VRGFGACFRAEWSDLLRQPLAWLAALATLATAVVVGLAIDGANGWVVYQAALAASGQAAGFFLLGIAAGTIASDRTRGTVRWILPRPIARRAYVLGKGAAILLLALVLVAVAGLASYLVALPRGFEDITVAAEVTEGFDFVEAERVPPEFKAEAMQARSRSATLRLVPALWTLAGLGLLVSALFRSAAGAVIAAIAIALPFHFLPELLALKASSAQFLPQRAAADALTQLGQYADRQSTAEWPGYSTAALLGAIVFCAGLPAVAAALFSRLDLTD
jgi:ABC-type transport system involved in multi-copper enzyme maturation permease subunit